MKRIINSVIAAALSIGFAAAQNSITQPNLNSSYPNTSINSGLPANTLPSINGSGNPAANGSIYSNNTSPLTPVGTVTPGTDIPVNSTNGLGTGSYQNNGINSNSGSFNSNGGNFGTSGSTTTVPGNFGTGSASGSAGSRNNGF